MPDMDGIAAAADNVPASAVVLQSLSHTPPYVLKALEASIRGFVAKDDGVECLRRAILMARADQHFFSPSVADELKSTTAALYSDASVRELLDVYDHEAPADAAYALAPAFQAAAFDRVRTRGDVLRAI